MENSANLARLVRREIDLLCVPPTIRGHRYLSYMVEQVAMDPERSAWITKDLYRETARRFRTTWSAVAQSCWAAITCCWGCEAGRERFGVVAGRRPAGRPAPTDFIEAVARYVTGQHRPG